MQQSGVAFKQLALAAHARDADRRTLIDRSMVGFAASQRLLGLGALDELADLDAGGRQHRQEVVFRVSRLPREQLDDADRRAGAHNREGDRRTQSCPALGAPLLVIVRSEVIHRGGHA